MAAEVDTGALELAEGELQKGRFASAFRAYLEYLDGRIGECGRSRVEFRATDLLALERLAELAVLFGAFDSADELLLTMANVLYRAGNATAADYSTLKRAEIALGRGNTDVALDHLLHLSGSQSDLAQIDLTKAGLAAWEPHVWPDEPVEDRAVLLTRLYLAMGKILAANGRYGEAAAALERGLLHTSNGVADLALRARVPLTLALAAARLELGDLAGADQALARIASQIGAARDPGFHVARLELSGKSALLAGRLGEGQRHFQSCFSVCQEYGFTRAAAVSALNLAHVLALLNHTGRAAALANEVEDQALRDGNVELAARAQFIRAVARARGRSSMDPVPVAPAVAQMHQRLAATRPAEAETDTLVPVDPPQPVSFLAFYEDCALAVHWSLAQNLMPQARLRLRQMENVFADTDSQLIHARMLVLSGIVHYYDWQKDTALEEAMRSLSTARSMLLSMGLRAELWQVIRFEGWCAARLGRPLAEQKRLIDQAEELLAELAASLDGADRAVFLLNKWTVDEEYTASECDELVEMKQRTNHISSWFRPFHRLRYIRRLSRFLSRIDEVRDITVTRSIDDASSFRRRGERLPFWRRLVDHSPTRALLAFTVLPDRVVTVLAERWRLDFSIAPVTRVELRQLVRQWHQMVADAQPNGGEINKAGVATSVALNELTDLIAQRLHLPEALDNLGARVRQLTIVPDDVLHGFPFAAIRRQGRPIVEDYAITIGFDTRRQRRLPRLRRRKRMVLLVGVSNGADGIPPLPGCAREIAAIAPLFSWPEQVVLENDQATEIAVIDALQAARVAHIACHGVFRSDRPDQSGLVLIPEENDVRMLTLRRLGALDLTGLDHVTLSSCWSADNFVWPGRIIVSLPETLCRAGARSVLGSLWQVDDDFSLCFARRFYDYAREHDCDEALRLTQLDCISRRLDGSLGVDSAAPVCWAGFTLRGEPGRLSF